MAHASSSSSSRSSSASAYGGIDSRSFGTAFGSTLRGPNFKSCTVLRGCSFYTFRVSSIFWGRVCYSQYKLYWSLVQCAVQARPLTSPSTPRQSLLLQPQLSTNKSPLQKLPLLCSTLQLHASQARFRCCHHHHHLLLLQFLMTNRPKQSCSSTQKQQQPPLATSPPPCPTSACGPS